MTGMRGVVLDVSPEELARRKRLGVDRWDEMWEGVLHMAPAPAYEHQRIVSKMLLFLAPLLEQRGAGTLVLGINVFRDRPLDDDYRIPDLTFVAEGRESILGPQGARGGPDAVVEVRSPGDETYEKLPFFAALGVREVIVVDRDTKRPEVYRLAGPQYVAVAEDVDGWVHSTCLGVRLRALAGATPRLAIEDSQNRSVRTEI
jgi:Uma2 family endonuclease